MHEQNYGGRQKHAGKIDQRAAFDAYLTLNNSADPEKQSDVQQQMEPIEMEKRIRRDAPIFAVYLAIIGQRAECQQRGVIPNAVGCELNPETDDDCNDQRNRSAARRFIIGVHFLSCRPRWRHLLLFPK